MRSKIIKGLTLLALCFIGTTARAGEDDFGMWTEVGATKLLPYGFSVSLDAGFRSANKFNDVDRWSGSVGIGYKLNKYVKFGANYMFLYEYSPASRKEDYKKFDLDNDGIDETEIVDPRTWNGYNQTEHYWTPKNRFNVEATGTIKLFRRLKVSLRERYQYTHKKRQMVPRMKYRYKNDQVTLKRAFSDPNEKEEKRTQYLRSRLRLEWGGKGWDFEPYVGFELFNNLDNELVLDKTRFSLGTSYKINSQHSVSVGYLFNNDVDEEPYEGKHVIDLGYSFKF